MADGETLSGRWRRLRKLWVPLVVLTALAGALRFLLLGRLPPGLYHDEAFNGLDALNILAGSLPIYFPGNHGREPLFVYLIAGTVEALGRTPAAIRAAAAICGTLTVPATYAMIRSWFNRSTALLGTAILSVTVWHLQLSRVGFRAVMLPLGIACFLAVLGRARRSKSPTLWLLSGILYGLLFYTYVAARFTPMALLGFGGWFVIRGMGKRLWPGVLYLTLGALATLIPLGAYATHHWDTVMGRPSQVSILNHAVHGGDLWGTLARHLANTAGMFFVRGDTIPRHNVPGRPVFGPLLGIAMILGTIQAGHRAKQGEPGSALILVWVVAMLVPTVAAADAPHFLRAVGVLPPLVVLPALGLESGLVAWNRRNRPMWASTTLCLIMALSLGSTVRDYFLHYAASPKTAYAFESAATDLAAEINRFTGVGWDGEGLSASDNPVDSEDRVYLDRRLWEAWESLPFLVPDQEALIIFPPDDPVSLVIGDESLLLLWPYGDLQRHLRALPQPARVEAHGGPLARGDLEEDAYPAYVSYRVTQPLEEQSSAPMARFGKSIELIDFDVERDADAWSVQLVWRARGAPDVAYTAFVYLCHEGCTGESLLAQNDAQPGEGYYPTHFWRAGDEVVDVRTLTAPDREPGPDRIAVGLYAWPALDRLAVTGPSGAPLGDMLYLPTDW